jgi:hypothetical protein
LPGDDRARLRASDADREQTATRLRHAASEGRLSADELEQRLQAAFAAKTCNELDWLVCDLPNDSEPQRPKALQGVRPLRPMIAAALAVALLVILIAGAVGIRFGRASAAAPPPLRAPRSAQALNGEQRPRARRREFSAAIEAEPPPPIQMPTRPRNGAGAAA